MYQIKQSRPSGRFEQNKESGRLALHDLSAQRRIAMVLPQVSTAQAELQLV